MLRSSWLRVLPALISCTLFAAPAVAHCGDAAMHNWPQWRGPLSTAVAPHATPPTEWSESKNVLWKVDLPGSGLSTPAVWGERIFVTTAVPAGDTQQSFLVLALSTRDGSELWRRTARTAAPHEGHHLDSSWASGSPITDGERVYAHYGSSGTYAYSLDGELLWQVDLGDMRTRNAFGEGASPALHDGKLIVPWDHEGDSFVVVLNAVSGEELWRVERPGEPTSWATPTVVEVGERTQVILPGTGRSRGYDLETGAEIWSLGGMTTNIIPTPPVHDGVVYLASGFRGNMLQAVDLAQAQGELEGTKAVLWSRDRDTPYVPSLVLYEGQLCFFKHYRNILTCLEAATGKEVYQARVEPLDNVWSSPIAADGKLYVLSREGKTAVLRHGKQYELLATNVLDDRFDATPVLVGDRIYLRGRAHLYAIAETPKAAEPTTAEAD